LGQKILLASGSMTYVIDKLERKKLIERESCDTDRRVIYVVITETGNDFMQQIFPKHQLLIEKLFSSLNEMEKQKSSALIKKIGYQAASS
jgi:MarR family transcriptional regulator, 2-MHQ and catechol-resistance regulon repressor